MSAKGDEFLLKARQQFRATRTAETLRKIAVPDLGMDVYFWPTRDLVERLAVEQHIKVGADRTMADLGRLHFAQVLHRARDEFGNRMFGDEQEGALADTSPTLIERISLEMGMGDGLTLEIAEKN